MKQSAKRLLSTLAALILAILAFVVFFYFVEPAYIEVKDATAQKLSLESFRDEQQHVISEVGKLMAVYEDSEDRRQVVSLALPLEPAIAEALAQLNGIAVNNNLAPQSFVVTTENTASETTGKVTSKAKSLIQPTSKIGFHAKLLGSYEDFKKFLSNLETNVRVFDIKTLVLSNGGKPGQNLYNFDLGVETYYQYQKK